MHELLFSPFKKIISVLFWNLSFSFAVLISLLFCFFVWPHLQHMDVPGLGVESELQLRPMPQPMPLGLSRLRDYTAAYGNTRSLTHWVKPGSNLHPHRYYVGYLTHWATAGTPIIKFLKTQTLPVFPKTYYCVKIYSQFFILINRW